MYRNFTPFDLKRLDSYSCNLLDYHVILDLVSVVAHQYFLGQFNSESIQKVSLSPIQAAIICSIGLQKKTFEEIEKDLGLPNSQLLALFGKAIKKCSTYLNEVVRKDHQNVYEQENPMTGVTGGRDILDDEAWDPTKQTLEQDLKEINDPEIEGLIKSRQKEMIDNLDLSTFTIDGNEEDWNNVKIAKGSKIVNIPSGLNSKKRKLTTGTAAGLAAKRESNGINDPGNLLTTQKKSGSKRKGTK